MVKKRVIIACSVVGLMFAFVACFSLPRFTNGSIECSTDPRRSCPSGYECLDNHCWLSALVDGGIDSAPSD